jgi:cell fate (sporulation/competence/biofilm development) regulator YlbF (YheA/YmcA/DUF963 family)
MGIFEIAAELGKALKQDEKLIALEAARKAYEEDKTVQRLVVEYNVQQKAMEKATQNAEIDTHLIELIQNRINELYTQITTSEAYVALEKAQEDVNALMNAVNTTISFHITGEMPSSCTHDCSTCGGCH